MSSKVRILTVQLNVFYMIFLVSSSLDMSELAKQAKKKLQAVSVWPSISFHISVHHIISFGSMKNEYLYIFSFQITYLKSWQWMCMMRLTEEKMMSVSNNTRLVLDQLFNFKNMKNSFVSAVFLFHTYRLLVSLNRLVTNTWQQGFSQWSTGGAFSSPQPRFFSHTQSGMNIFS